MQKLKVLLENVFFESVYTEDIYNQISSELYNNARKLNINLDKSIIINLNAGADLLNSSYLQG